MDPVLLAVVPGAIGYSMLYLLFGGGITGAIIVFFLTRAMGR